MVGKILVIILALLNLGLAIWSGQSWNWDFEPWLKGFPLAVPLLVVGLGCLAKSIFMVNLGAPSLLFFGWLLFKGAVGGVELYLRDLALALVVVDVIYIISVTFRYRYWKELFWGILAGAGILFAFHQALFGEGISIKGNIMKLYDNSVEWVDKKVGSTKNMPTK